MSNLVKSTTVLLIVTIISKILGFFREIVLGSLYGISIYSDAYITAFNIPIVIFSLISTALSTTFIPLYYENNKISPNKSIHFTNNVLNITIVFSFILAIVGFIFAEILVKIFAVGFEGEQFKLTVEFTRIMLFGGIFIGINNIMASLLQIKENFIVPGIVGLPFNIIIILSIILSLKINIYILPVGTVLAMISQFLLQFIFVQRNEYKYKLLFNINDKYIRKMIWLVSPVLIGVSVNQINTMVDRTIASTLVEGSISALNYANKLNGFVTGVFISTLATIIYPMLSKLSVNDNKTDFIEVIVKSINIVCILIMPITVGAIVLAKPIVSLLFERGVFDSRATLMTSNALIFYSIGMIGFGVRDILGKVFYSLQDTKIPMVNGIITMMMNIGFNIVLSKTMGYSGLALGTSLSSLIGVVIMFRSLSKKIGYFKYDKIINTAVKSFIASIIMGIIVKIIYNLLVKISILNQFILVFGSIVIGGTAYILLVLLLRIEEINLVSTMLSSKINMNKLKKFLANI